MLAHKCLACVQREFQRLGGKILTCRAENIQPGEKSVRVMTRSGTGEVQSLEFRRIAVCAGPWSSDLLPKCAHLLSTQSIPVTYWRELTRPHRHSVAAGCPVIFNARMANVYCVPSFEYPGLVKVLVHSGPETTPDRRDLWIGPLQWST